MIHLLSSIYLGWALGANDSANVFGTGVTTRVIKYSSAVILTGIFAILGAVIEGRKCMDTVGFLTDLNVTTASVATIVAALTVTIMTAKSLPVSTSQAILGSIGGVAVLNSGLTGLPLQKLLKIFLCWVLTPVGAMIIAFILLHFTRSIFRKIMGLGTLLQVIKMGIVVVGCMGAYALGSNNVANTTGAFVGAGLISPFWGALLGGVSIAIGSITYSKKVMITIGKKITNLGPLSAFIVVLSEAITVYIYTQIGVPVSTSQAVVGAVAGIGLYTGVKTVNKKTLLNIFIGWITTPIIGAVVTFSVMTIINNLF